MSEETTRITEVAAEESADDIQKHINDLQKKLQKLELEEEGEIEKVTLPLANVHLRLDRTLSVIREMVTPPELQLLIAEHHRNAGGMPVLEVILMDKVKQNLVEQAEKDENKSRGAALKKLAEKLPKSVTIDPRTERNRLTARYGADRVQKLFPGSEPNMPKTFRRAMSLGIEQPFEQARLFGAHTTESKLFEMQAFT